MRFGIFLLFLETEFKPEDTVNLLTPYAHNAYHRRHTSTFYLVVL